MKPPSLNPLRFNGPAAESAPWCLFSPETRQRAIARVLQGLRVVGLDPMLGLRPTALANELGEGSIALTGLANEITAPTGDGWALIPYGDHPNERGLQRFGRAEADQMVGYFKNGWNRLKRAMVGMPILRGHPDMVGTVREELKRTPKEDTSKRTALQALINSIEVRYPDKTVYGTVTDLEARADGLALRCFLTEAGVALVNEGGLTCFSPHWLGIDGDPVNGRPMKLPIYLVSIGLTARPNIAGTSLVNDRPDFPAMNRHLLLLQILAALGRPLANEATEEQINAGLAAALPHAQALSARPETTALANEQSRATQLAADLATVTTALGNERTAHTATVKARNELLVGGAIAAGRITEAQRPIWLGRLDRDFSLESVALANEQPVVKTRALTAGLGARKPANTASDQFTALVNERVAKGENWTPAWEAVKGTKEGAALYEEMHKAPAA